jgi:uncharacterized membrane protein YhaH (DUF805 family)
MSWFLAALRKYATFAGRAQRSEYWYFILIYLLVYVALLIAGGVIGSSSPMLSTGLQLLGALFSLGMFIPSLAVSVRRLHDTDRSGWWFLIGLVPLIGSIVLLVFFVQDSQPGENRFGPNPKGVASASGAASGGISKAVIAAVVGLFLVFIAGIVAAVAIPAYHDYQARVAMSQALGELARFRPGLAELVKRGNSAPSLSDVGISLPSRNNFDSLYYDPKSLTLVGNLAGSFRGRSIGLQYRSSSGGSPMLVCGSKNLEMKYLPSSCRNQLQYLDEREAMNLQRAAPEPAKPLATSAPAPAAMPSHAVPPALPTAAPAAPPIQAEVAPAKAVAAPAAAPSTTTLDTGSGTGDKPRPVALRRAVAERKQDTAPRLKSVQSECVYKPVMTDEDIAKCR